MMQPELCQRWTRQRASYRPAGEPIDPSRYGVELLDEKPARAFVANHHYSRSYPAARCRVGLYEAGRTRLRGDREDCDPHEPSIPRWRPGSSWFLARAFAELKKAKPGVRAVLIHLGRSSKKTHILGPDGRAGPYPKKAA